MILSKFLNLIYYEIYFQLESNEVSIEKLKLKAISEKYSYKISSAGPMNLLNTDSLLSEKIINLKIDEFSEPFKFNKKMGDFSFERKKGGGI